MAFSRASIKYKPLRVGFLAREGHVEDLRQAAGINCLLWGGMYNPLIPVPSGDTSVAERLIDLFSVDVLYAVADSPEIQSVLAKYPFLRDPRHLGEKIFYEDWHSKKQVLGLLDAKNIVDFFWEKEYKHKPPDQKSNCLHLQWDANDTLAALLSLQFGFFPSEPDLKWNYAKIFVTGLHAREQVLSPSEPLTMDAQRSLGPIEITAAELRAYGGGFPWGGNGIYLGAAASFDDLVTFWNVRAAGNSVVFLATDQMDRTLPFAQGFVTYLDSLPNRHPNIEDRITLYHKIADDEQRRALGQHLSIGKGILWHPISEHSWNGFNIQPAYQVFTWQTATMHVEPAYGHYAVHVELPEKSFLVNEDDPEVARQHLGVIIDAFGDFGHPGYTLKVPRIRALNEFYSREMAVDPWALRVEREGLSRRISTSDDSVDLYPLPKQILVEKVFEVAGLTAEMSQAGLIARKVLEKIGGLEDARVLKIRGVRKILQDYSPGESISRGEATRIIHENDFAKYKHLYIEAREKPELNSNDVFDYLLKKDFFRAGLELQCAHCKLANWLTLKSIDDFWLCEYCGGQNQTSLHLKSRGDWRFRKSGLFAKDNNQEGAIPVLLTLLTLKRILDHSTFGYSTALNLRGQNVKCETDLAVLHYGRPDEMEIAVGECKSDGGSITPEDCQNLRAVAELLRTVEGSTTICVLFSKTTDSFRPEEIALFKDLARDVELVLLTNRELELYHPYWLEDGQIEDVPEKYPHSLADLARNSAARYLA